MGNATKLSARARIEALVDAGSFVEIGEKITKRNTDFNMGEKELPADGVITGYGVIGEKLVFVYSQDSGSMGGAIGEMHAKKIVNILQMADRSNAPVIGLIDCSGIRFEEGMDALAGFGEIYQKKLDLGCGEYQIDAILGSCGGGVAVVSSMADIVLMDRQNGELFVNSPNAIQGNYKEKNNTASADFQAAAGNVDIVCDNEVEVIDKIRELVTMLPSGPDDTVKNVDSANRALSGAPGFGIEAMKAIADDGWVIELGEEYGKEMATGIFSLDGQAVGCVANGSEGILSTDGCRKAANFINFCDSFDIPLITLTNAKEYASSIDEERTIARAVASMSMAYADFRSTSINVITGEAYGSAYLAMNPKHMKAADIVFALKDAKVGVMDAKLAGKAFGGDDNSAVKEIAEKLDEMQNGANAAAKRGYVDSIIDSKDLRKHLIYALQIFGK